MLQRPFLTRIGQLVVVLGVATGMIGGIYNALLYHDIAIDLWLYSNLFLLLWAIGFRKKLWNSSLSVDFLIILYAFYELCNIYAISLR